MQRRATILRRTNEVKIQGEFVIDGQGKTEIHTGFVALDHLLTLFAFHGLFDLHLKAEGDLSHHIIEDIGIALGKALKEALGDKAGIKRFGCFTGVMDKVAIEVALDISGRGSLYGVSILGKEISISEFSASDFDGTGFYGEHAQEFMEAFLRHSGISMVYVVKSQQGDLHHLLEALFKALGKALDMATQLDPRRQGVPSTKGVID